LAWYSWMFISQPCVGGSLHQWHKQSHKEKKFIQILSETPKITIFVIT